MHSGANVLISEQQTCGENYILVTHPNASEPRLVHGENTPHTHTHTLTSFNSALDVLKVFGHIAQRSIGVAADCSEFGEHPFQFFVHGAARIVFVRGLVHFWSRFTDADGVGRMVAEGRSNVDVDQLPVRSDFVCVATVNKTNLYA